MPRTVDPGQLGTAAACLPHCHGRPPARPPAARRRRLQVCQMPPGMLPGNALHALAPALWCPLLAQSMLCLQGVVARKSWAASLHP